MAYAPAFYVGLNGNWLTLKSDGPNLEHVQAVYLAFPLNAVDDKVAALNLQKWSVLGTTTVGIAGAAAPPPTLKALAQNGQKLGNAIDLTAAAARNRFLGLELLCRFVNGSLTGTVEVYFLPSIDGTNYADGDDTIVPDISHRVAIFTPRAVTTQQRMAAVWSLSGTSPVTGRSIVIPPFKFKPLVRNLAGQAMTNTDNENVLNYRVYDLEHVSPPAP